MTAELHDGYQIAPEKKFLDVIKNLPLAVQQEFQKQVSFNNNGIRSEELKQDKSIITHQEEKVTVQTTLQKNIGQRKGRSF